MEGKLYIVTYHQYFIHAYDIMSRWFSPIRSAKKKTTKKQKIRTIANQRRILCATNYQQNNDMTTVRRMHNESGWRWEAVVKLLPFLFFEISHNPKYDSPSIRKTKQIQLNEDIFCDTYANCAAIHLVLNSQLVSNGSMSMNHIIMAYLLLST